jgi:hypothetical protein
MRSTILIGCVVLAQACDTNSGSDADLKDIRASVARLEAENAELRGQIENVTTQLASLQSSTDTLGSVLEGVSRTEDGDFVFEGVNVQIKSGAVTANGKGNLVVGDNGPWLEGTCAGGANMGQSCTYDGNCPDSTCEDILDVTERTGSHNIVVGDGHSYTGSGNVVLGLVQTVEGYGNLVAGRFNAAQADSGVIFGEGNVVSADVGAVLGGLQNTTASGHGVVVGGSTNSCEPGAGAGVVVGGYGNTADAEWEIAP